MVNIDSARPEIPSAPKPAEQAAEMSTNVLVDTSTAFLITLHKETRAGDSERSVADVIGRVSPYLTDAPRSTSCSKGDECNTRQERKNTGKIALIVRHFPALSSAHRVLATAPPRWVLAFTPGR